MSRFQAMVRLFLVLVIVATATVVVQYRYYRKPAIDPDPCKTLRYHSPDDFEGFDNVTGAPHGCTIVPNFVHFVKFRQTSFDFGSAVCLLAALKHQRPDKIFIHTDAERFKGRYWELLMSTPGFKERLLVKRRSFPEEIFARKTHFKVFHASDITRLRVLMEHGGIYLDNDSYIVKNMDQFRRYEMSLGWKPGKSLGNAVLVAHRNARFLQEWLETYRVDYRPKNFYYNAGDYPTRAVLNKRPHLVHRVHPHFGNHGVLRKIYIHRFQEWRDYFALHTQYNRVQNVKKEWLQLFPQRVFPKKFTEQNIMDYPVAYRDMVLDVWPTDLSNSTTRPVEQP